MLLGFSTGVLNKTHERISKETLAIFRSMGCNAIQLMCVDNAHIEKLVNEISPGDLSGFEHVSLHAPNPDLRTIELLQKAQEIFHLQSIVIHPSEVESWSLFVGVNLPFAIENMDWRKDIGKYVDSLKDIFSKFDVSMFLDLNHCYTNDPSMHLAREMSEAFREKIVGIHVSGFERLHEPLCRTKQKEILEAIPEKNLPIIIESLCENVEEAKQEFEYIKNFLEKREKKAQIKQNIEKAETVKKIV